MGSLRSKIPQDLLQRYELFVNLTQRELRGKYKRTVFGQLWSLANPIALMLVYTLVFSFIIRMQIPPGDPSGLSFYPLWLLCGLLPWIYFATVITQGINSLIDNEALIRKVYFPRNLLIFSSVAAISTNWLVEMGVLLVALLIAGAFGVLPLLPLAVLIMMFFALFSSGIVLALSIANVYFRDTQYLVTVALQLGMYLTPVIYPVSLVAEQSEKVGPLFGNFTLLDLYSLNPLEKYIAVFRELLYDNSIPPFSDLFYCFIAAAISICIGVFIFNKNEKKLAEIL